MANPFLPQERQNPFLEADAMRQFERGQNSFGIDFTKPVGEVREAIGKLPEKERQEALKVWAKFYVDRERAEEGTGLDDRVRALARGTPVGSFLDEANAKTQSALHAVSFGYLGAPEEETLAYNRARDQAFDEANPIQSTALKVAGGIASVPAAAPFTAGAGALQGGSLLGRIGAGSAYGAGWGGLYGYGEGEGGVADRLSNAGRGAVIGAGGGALAPVVGAGARQAVGYVGSRLAPLPGAVRDYSRGAVDRVARALREDQVTGQTVDDVGERLGREGMILDMGPNVLGHAETIAHRPGAGAPTVLQAVTQRGRDAAGRITRDTDEVLGPQRDTPALLKHFKETRATDANALYGALRDDELNSALWNDTLQGLTMRPSIKKAVASAVKTAAERQYTITNPFRTLKDGRLSLKNRKVQPTFMFWDHVKRNLDRQIRIDPGNRDLIATVNALKDEMDRLVPGYAAARKRFADQSDVIDAVEEGKSAFARGVDPNELRARMDEMSVPESAGFRLGARQNIADVMGEAVDPESTARRTFASPYARERLNVVVGEEGGQRLANRLDAEGTFQRAENQIRGNSATQRRKEFSSLYPAPGENPALRGLENTTAAGWTARAVGEVVNAMTAGALGKRAELIASDAARLLTASGDARDRVAAALLQRGAQLETTQLTSDLADRIVQALMQAGRAPLIEATGQ